MMSPLPYIQKQWDHAEGSLKVHFNGSIDETRSNSQMSYYTKSVCNRKRAANEMGHRTGHRMVAKKCGEAAHSCLNIVS